MPLSKMRRVAVFGVLVFVSGCSMLAATPPEPWMAAVAGDGPGDPQLVRHVEVVVENLPKSTRGNPAVYSVFDQAYKVMDSAVDYEDWGVASWYGKKFHGRETSSGEVYDMHAYTAAHKSLPLPTFVRVTRLDSDESIIVKVNDRGPFVGDRIIDLSYAAATSLGMLDTGKVEVHIEALSSHHVDNRAVTQASTNAVNSEDLKRQSLSSSDLYIQVGAFSEEQNAHRMLNKIRQFVVQPVGIATDSRGQLYRVRIGPMADEYSVQEALDTLSVVGIENYTVVAFNP